MSFKKIVVVLVLGVLWSLSTVSHSFGEGGRRGDWQPEVTFVEFHSLDLEQQPPGLLTIKGKLKLPIRYKWREKCFKPKKNLPAVVILHGSAGIDFRGDFYARALNEAGIATLEIDMWEARGIQSAADRPQIPLLTYPDAFGALQFLSEHPNINPDRIGVLGFSWGGAITMASATESYASQFGGELRFAAHAAHYPICYAYNSPIPGSDFFDLTGAPILIQIGEEDDYDNGSGPCFALRESLTPEEQNWVDINTYIGAFHAWDRLQVPITVEDPFSNRGAGGEVKMIPDVAQADRSRRKIVKFFLHNL